MTVSVAFEVGLKLTVVLMFACNGIKIIILSCVVSFFFKVMSKISVNVHSRKEFVQTVNEYETVAC